MSLYRCVHRSFVRPVLLRAGLCALSGLFGLTACHRRLPPVPAAPRTPPRPVAVEPELERFAARAGVRLAPAPAAPAAELTPAALRRMALDADADAIAAKAGLERARARAAAAGLWPNPRLAGRVLGLQTGGVRGEAALLFALPVGGRLGAEVEQAAADQALATLDLELARLQALRRLERGLLRLAHARAEVALLRGLVERSKQNAAVVEARGRSALADPLDAALVHAQQARDRQALVRARAELRLQQRRLRLLVGLAPGTGRLPETGLDAAELDEVPAGLRRDGAAGHPAVRRARLVLALAERQAARVAAERVPDVELGPAFDGGPDGVAGGVTLGIELPLLDSGAADYRRALASRTAAAAALRQAQREAAVAVADRLAALGARRDELAALEEESADRVAEAVALAESRFAAGRLDAVRLLALHRAHVELELDRLRLRRDVRLARTALERVVGRPLRLKEGSR